CNFDYGTGPTNQVAALSTAGYFAASVSGVHTLPALAASTNSAVSLEYRVRSYLAANCAQCHQPNGPATALWDGRISTPTAQAGLINGALYNDSAGTNNRVVVPGSSANSMLLTRISTLGSGHMPPVAATMPDTQAIALLNAWITNDLPNYQT